ELGRTSDALAAYQEALRFEPDNPMAQHMVLALGGVSSDTSSSLDYVKELFDHYAPTFDEHLEGCLNYRTPELLASLVNEIRLWTPRSSDVLDLGCGTGLAGAAILPLACRLIGVDISGKMLEVAARRGIYTALEQGDLMSSLIKAAASSFDLILAADV